MIPRTTLILAAAITLVLMAQLAIYYADGPAFLLWSDSVGYLEQALSILKSDNYVRAAGRSVGYPLVLAGVLAIEFKAAAIFAAQALIVVAAYAIMFGFLSSVAPRLRLGQGPGGSHFKWQLALFMSATTLYGALHILIASLLPEIVFAFLALLGVLSVSLVVLSQPGHRRLWPLALAAAILACLPLLVKPHWLFAAPLLIAIIAVRVAIAAKRSRPGISGYGAAVLASAMIFAIGWAVTAPDRYLARTAAGPGDQLFGAKTVFCNHLHLTLAALARNPRLRLHRDGAPARQLRAHMEEMRARHKSGWRRLGFNGDLCTYDPKFDSLTARLFPAPADRSSFFLATTARAALSDPLPFAHKVLLQLWYGLVTPFEKFTPHYRLSLFDGAHRAVAKRLRVGGDFFSGLRLTGEAGPFASKQFMKKTLAGRLGQGAIAAFFTLAGVIYAVMVVISLIAPVWRWRRWTPERQRTFAALLGVPIAAIAAHHLLVALSHSFDIWRYGFNLFFVNVAFLVCSWLFWRNEWIAQRAGKDR